MSPLLFWAIIMVGSRRYRKNPTLLGFLSPHVTDLALMSVKFPISIPMIRGLLLLVNWPAPVKSKWTEITFTLAGILIHSAMQIGLHMPISSQDFSRKKLNLSRRRV